MLWIRYPPRLPCTCSYLAHFINQPFQADVALRFSLDSGCRFDWQTWCVSRCRASNKRTHTHTPHTTPTYKHAHSWSGLARDNGIRDHHLPLLSRHLILPTLLCFFCLSVPYCPLSLSSPPSDSYNVRAPLSLTFLAVSLNSRRVIPAKLIKFASTERTHPHRPCFPPPPLLEVLIYFSAILQSTSLPLHPFSLPSLQSCHHGSVPHSHCSPVACPTPLSPNPLKGKRLGREFNRCTTRIEPDQPTKRQNRSPPSLQPPSSSSSSLPPCMPLPHLLLPLSPLAFISGDKGLFVRAGSAERWCPGWRNVAHHFCVCVCKKIWCIWFFFKREQIVTGDRQTICVFFFLSNKINQNKLSNNSHLVSHVLLLMVGLSGRQNTGEWRKTSTRTRTVFSWVSPESFVWSVDFSVLIPHLTSSFAPVFVTAATRCRHPCKHWPLWPP